MSQVLARVYSRSYLVRPFPVRPSVAMMQIRFAHRGTRHSGIPDIGSLDGMAAVCRVLNISVSDEPQFDVDELLGDDEEGEEDSVEEIFVNPITGERGGPRGPEPTRFGDWEKGGRVSDF